jgi:cytochrome oxidase assembly protein ShyY1
MAAVQGLMRKQQERLQLEQQQPQQQQRQLKQQAAVAQQRGLSARLKLEPVAVSAASRPQGSPAACLTLSLPAPGWREQ